MSYRDPQKQRDYQREYYHRRVKKASLEDLKRNDYDHYVYKVVPDHWRKKIQTKRRNPYALQDISSPIVKDLLDGKTVYVDFTVPLGRSPHIPFRTLYPYFQVRGLRLRMYMIDLPEKGEYRKLIMWCEPLEGTVAA